MTHVIKKDRKIMFSLITCVLAFARVCVYVCSHEQRYDLFKRLFKLLIIVIQVLSENLHVDVEQGKGPIIHNANFGPCSHV